MKGYQIAIIVLVFFALGYFLSDKAFAGTGKSDSIPLNTSVPGFVDLWCENGKYYKRTSTSVYGVIDKLEITKTQFDVFVSQGISYSGCG